MKTQASDEIQAARAVCWTAQAFLEKAADRQDLQNAVTRWLKVRGEVSAGAFAK